MKKIIEFVLIICICLNFSSAKALDSNYTDNASVKNAPGKIFIFTGTVQSFTRTNIVVVRKVNNIFYSYFFHLTDTTEITGNLALGIKVEVTYTRKVVSSDHRYKKTALKIRVLK